MRRNPWALTLVMIADELNRWVDTTTILASLDDEFDAEDRAVEAALVHLNNVGRTQGIFAFPCGGGSWTD